MGRYLAKQDNRSSFRRNRIMQLPRYSIGSRRLTAMAIRGTIALLLTLALREHLAAQALFENLGKPQQGRSMRANSTFRAGADGKYDRHADPLANTTGEKSNFDNFRVPPGETHVVMDVQGPGAITHMWFTFLEPAPKRGNRPGQANHQEILLRIYWDGDEKPAVEAPFGDFFASCFGKRCAVNSLPVVVEGGDSYNCYWFMPFRKSARIELVNQSEKPFNLLYYNIDWIKKEIAADAPYFHAQYRQEYPQEGGEDYVILDTQGKGHYVGTVLAVRTRSPLWFGEGDEKIYIDGEKTASIWGTGTEDFFCCAMGLESCSTPYFGVPQFNQFEIVGSMTSAYRWHLADPIVFEKGIKVTLEHKSWISADENPDHVKMSCNEREDDYSSVAFWYQIGESTFAARAPGARERKLPNIERVVACGKEFADAKHHGAGTAQAQEINELFEEPQLFYCPGTPENAWVEIPIEVKRKEPLRLLINAACAPDYGRYQASLDGVRLGGVLDFYADNLTDKEFHLLDFWPEPGVYTLRLDCIGKSAKSEGWNLGLESVRLRERRPRVEKYGHDKDNDWRKNPLFYTK
jgi:hypothetical protein